MHCCKILLDRSQNIEEHPCHSFLPVELGTEGTSIRILTCSMKDSNTGYSMIDIKDDRGVLEEGHYPSNGGDCNITRLSSNHYMAMVTNPRCFLSKIINESGCFLVSAEPETDTLIRWTLIGPNSTVLHNLSWFLANCPGCIHSDAASGGVFQHGHGSRVLRCPQEDQS